MGKFLVIFLEKMSLFFIRNFWFYLEFISVFPSGQIWGLALNFLDCFRDFLLITDFPRIVSALA